MFISNITKTLNPLRRLVAKLLWKQARGVRSDYVAAVLFHGIHHKRLSLLVGQNTFSERIALRNARPHPEFSVLSDKQEVRTFVKDKVGSEYLIPVYAVVDDMAEFDFSSLPTSFVMKATHGSGWVRLVEDQNRESPADLRELAKSWLSDSYYFSFREKQYKFIRPRIIFEKLLLEDGVPADDYKIHCFRKNGQLTQIIQVHSDRFGDHKVNILSSDWKDLKMSHGFDQAAAETVKKPDQIAELLEVADRLSIDWNYVRVDLYVSAGRVFFGELTFTPGAGVVRFQPKEADRQWATLFDKDHYPGSFKDRVA